MPSIVNPPGSLSGLNVPPGEPGIDTTNTTGPLLIADNNATFVEFGAAIGSTSKNPSGALQLSAGDPIGPNINSQIEFGYNGIFPFPNYPHFITTQHQASSATGNIIKFWTNDSTQLGIFPTNAIFGLGIDSGHLFVGSGGAPATSNLGANVTSATFTGNDARGTIAIVMSAGLAANTRVFTATFFFSYGAISPKITLVDQTSTAGLAIVNSYVLAQATGVSFDVAFDQALVAGTYIIDYIVIG